MWMNCPACGRVSKIPVSSHAERKLFNRKAALFQICLLDTGDFTLTREIERTETMGMT
jgi:hypothetical protein